MALVSVARDTPEEGRRPRRHSIAVSLDGEAWLRVSADELLELGISDGDAIDDERRADLELSLARTRARSFAVRSLATRAQSVTELEAKLAARAIPTEIVRETVELARSYGYLDDDALAAQLARGHVSRGYGRRRAGQALQARGLAREIAEQALEDAYAGDEVAQALIALGQRDFGEGDTGRRKAASFLARRGFSGQAAWAAVHARERGERPTG